MSRAKTISTVRSLFAIICFLGIAATAFAGTDSTTTTVNSPSSPVSVAVGGSISFDVTVSDCSGGPPGCSANGAPQGHIIVRIDATASGCGTGTAATTSPSTATLATVTPATTPPSSHVAFTASSAALTTGAPHTATVCYVSSNTGGSGWASDTTGIDITVNVTGAATSIAIMSPTSPNSTTLGTAVTITARVTDTGATGNTLSGYVEFFDGSAMIGSAATGATTSNHADATFITSILETGGHTITATYISTTANFGNSTPSSALSQTMTTRGTSTAVQPFAAITLGQTAPAAVQVSDTVNGAAAGTYASNTGDVTQQNLTTNRTGHTATLLPNGTVLVVGGRNMGGVLVGGSPEIYTSGSGFGTCSICVGTFTDRTSATATLLQNGMVLIVGGSSDGTNAVMSAEIFNPADGSVTATGSLGTARMGHTATLLSNGNVVIAGGSSTFSGAGLATAEVFTGSSFSPVTGSNMFAARKGHTASLITTGPDAGAILMAGGDAGSAELYTVTGTTGTQTATGLSMAAARSFHTARRMPDGRIILSGGSVSSSPVATSEIYNPANRTFVLVGGVDWAATTPYSFGTIITPAPGNNAGGYSFKCTTAGTSGGSTPAFAQVVGNTTTDGGVTWTNIGVRTMTDARQGHTATLLDDGEVLLVAGTDASAIINTAELYTPSFDPLGAITFASDNGTASTPDTLVNCALTLNGTGHSSCNGSVTPQLVGSTPHVVTATYADNTVPDHAGSSDATGQSLTVNKPTITLAASAKDKVYDGTTDSDGTVTVGGPDAGVLATLGHSAKQFYDVKDAGVANRTLTPQVVDGSGNIVTSSYNVTTTTSVMGNTISPKPLTQTGLSVPASKPYDGTTEAGVSGPPTLLGAEAYAFGTGGDGKPYSLDSVSITGTAVGTYNTKDVATANSVTFSGISLAGTQAGDYTLVIQSPASATITKKSLTQTGLSVPASKVYDGTTQATVNGTASLLAPEPTGFGTGNDGHPYNMELVSITGTPGGTYDSKDVGGGSLTAATMVSFSGLSLTGADSVNYSLAIQSPAPATITPKALTQTGLSVPASKIYDGTTAAVVSGPAALLSAESPFFNTGGDGAPYTGDTVSITGTPAGTYNSKDVGGGTLTPATTVTFSGLSLAGTHATDYSLTIQSPQAATITPKALTQSGLSVPPSKVYDGSTTAVVSGSAVLPGAETGGTGSTSDGKPYTGDTVSISGTPSGTYNSKDVGGGTLTPATTVTFGGMSLAGTHATDYSLTVQTAAAATITPKTLVVTGLSAANKQYDATQNATLNGAAALLTAEAVGSGSTLDGTPYNVDTVALFGAPVGTFASKNVGTAVSVTVSGNTLTGTHATDYVLAANEQSGLSANITPAPLTITAQTNTKGYDTTTSAAAVPTVAGLQGSDTVTGLVETYDTKNIGTGKTLSVTAYTVNDGNAGNNYTVVTVADTTGVINKATLTITAQSNTKTYDSTASAAALPTVSGLLGGDTVTGLAETYDTPNAGTGKTLSVSAYTVNDGNAGGNYTVVTVTNTAGVIKQLNITATLTASNKVYDSTNAEPNASMSCSLTGVLAGDVASLTCAASGGTFNTANVTTATTVTATATISGSAVGNYTLGAVGTAVTSATVTAAAKITARPITITANSINKVLGTTYTFTGTEFTQTGLATGDTLLTVTMSSTGSPSGAGFGTYPIVITALATGNYTGTLVTSNYTITLVNGVMSVGQADTFVILGSSLTAALTSAGGTFTLTATVGSKTTGTPTGTVTFTDNGTVLGTSPVIVSGTAGTGGNAAVTLSGGTATLSGITLAASATPHVIVATYSGDVNYKGSSLTVNITVALSPPTIVAGTPSAPTAPVTYSGAFTTAGALTTADLTCTVQSAVVAVVQALTSCSATLNPSPLAAGLTGTVTITIKTSSGSVAALRPLQNPAGSPLRSLYALSLAMPGLVFIGLAAPLATLRKKGLRRKVLGWIGLALVLSLLLLSMGCGGSGFTNTNNLPAVGSVNRTQAGSYTAVVTYKDANGKDQVLVSMAFTVN